MRDIVPVAGIAAIAYGRDMSQPRLTKSRIILIAFALAALLLSVSPLAVRWWVAHDACPRQIIAEGYFSDGMFWRIRQAECGGAIGTVWQVHISAADTQPRLAFDAQNAPRPLSVEQNKGAITIRLDQPPAGSTEASVTIPIVPKMRPKRILHFIDGKPR